MGLRSGRASFCAGGPAGDCLLDSTPRGDVPLTAALESLRACLGSLARGIREPRMYAALALALLLWALAYQNKRDYTVQVADLAYHPDISNFNDIETTTTNPPFNYRWSK